LLSGWVEGGSRKKLDKERGFKGTQNREFLKCGYIKTSSNRKEHDVSFERGKTGESTLTLAGVQRERKKGNLKMRL